MVKWQREGGMYDYIKGFDESYTMKWDGNFQAMETIKVEMKVYFKEFNYTHMRK
jgi:hypothetical protein